MKEFIDDLMKPAPHPVRDTRRTFLKQTGLAAMAVAGSAGSVAAGGGGHAAAMAQADGEVQAPAFNFNGVTMPLRRSFYDYSQADVLQLANAYARLKALPSTDPRAWLNQANIHASHCGGNLMEVHGGWWFTVWHRCYVFFYERILASLSDSPTTFALPYWDWSNHPEIPNTQVNESQGAPSPFFDQTSSLFDPNRAPGPQTTFNDDPLSTGVASFTTTAYLTQILADDFDDFGGSDPSLQGGRGAGDLEAGPHNTVHTWTGIAQSPYIDMGNLSTAAQDLLFFLHHSNVDRQFTLWLGQGFPLPPQGSPWYTQFFNFFDERGNSVSVTVNDALQHMAGNYQAPQQSFSLVAQPQEMRLDGPPKVVNTLKVPEAMQKNIAVAPLEQKPRHRKVQLRIEGIEVPHDALTIVHVFLGKPDATLKDIQGPNFVGTIHVLPSSAAHGQASRPFNATLDLSGKAGLLRQAGENGPIVTFVPVNPQLKPDAMAPTFKFKKIVVVTKH